MTSLSFLLCGDPTPLTCGDRNRAGPSLQESEAESYRNNHRKTMETPVNTNKTARIARRVASTGARWAAVAALSAAAVFTGAGVLSGSAGTAAVADDLGWDSTGGTVVAADLGWDSTGGTVVAADLGWDGVPTATTDGSDDLGWD
ncbi:hypothetical protein GCM10009759_45350 [Kitasatospora saccharophila]|uniref:Uncharacterized protein n=2 Tax=Kitasatospora saccharophila TaxID=407973 RepID=A0ABN2XAA2_9ACTN